MLFALAAFGILGVGAAVFVGAAYTIGRVLFRNYN